MPAGDTGGMTGKDRQRLRNRLTPHGRMPNWVLAVVAGVLSVLAAVIARALG